MSTLQVTNIKKTGETASRDVSGVAAAWVNFAGVADTIQDSINVASITDNGTADYTLAWTSSFGNVNYSHAGMSGADVTEMVVVNQPYEVAAPTTSASRYLTTTANGSVYETVRVNISIHGDLA
jgi:hypothetical protein